MFFVALGNPAAFGQIQNLSQAMSMPVQQKEGTRELILTGKPLFSRMKWHWHFFFMMLYRRVHLHHQFDRCLIFSYY